jgi:hypothetical protein
VAFHSEKEEKPPSLGWPGHEADHTVLTYTMDPYSLNTTVNLHTFLNKVFLCDAYDIYTFMIFIDFAVFMYWSENSNKFRNMEG